MSGNGEDDRREAKPGQNAFLDEADPPPVRQRRAKPPPGIITAGGVDMARAHASGIKLREQTAAEPSLDQPRVVVAVEIDPRKVPTHKRLLEGREHAADGARAAMLPGGSVNTTPRSGVDVPRAPTARAEPAAAVEPARRLPAWTRALLVTAVLLFVASAAQRLRPRAATVTDGDSVAARPSPPPRAPAPIVAAPPPPAVVAPPPPTAPALTSSSSAPAPSRPVQLVNRPPPATPPRATFTPPFQLPGEKK